MHVAMHRQPYQAPPCDDCGHKRACMADSHECRAFCDWQQLRAWKPQDRSRTPLVGRGHEWVPNDEQRRQVRALHAAGVPVREIAKRMQVAIPTLYARCREELAAKTLRPRRPDAKVPNRYPDASTLLCAAGAND